MNKRTFYNNKNKNKNKRNKKNEKLGSYASRLIIWEMLSKDKSDEWHKKHPRPTQTEEEKNLLISKRFFYESKSSMDKPHIKKEDDKPHIKKEDDKDEPLIKEEDDKDEPLIKKEDDKDESIEEFINKCVECGIDMGYCNPRQLCGKTYCINKI